MRVVFFGTPAFAVPSLSALLESRIDVAAVVTQPDRPKGRSHSTLVAPPVKIHALEAGIPVLQPERPRGDDFHHQLRTLNADLGVVVAYGHLLRPELLQIPRFGCVNVHASLLPRWRGAAPIQWALLAGDSETGVSIMRVEAGLDTGAVWRTSGTTIDATDTAASLTERLSTIGAAALIASLPQITSRATPVAQDDLRATHAPKIDREIARIRWNEPASAVSCRVRAMDPAPGAWTTINGADLKMFGAAVAGARAAADAPDVRGHDHVPGALASAGAAHDAGVHGAASIPIHTADGTVLIAEIQPSGRRRMPASEWLRGANLAEGARFA